MVAASQTPPTPVSSPSTERIDRGSRGSQAARPTAHMRAAQRGSVPRLQMAFANVSAPIASRRTWWIAAGRCDRALGQARAGDCSKTARVGSRMERFASRLGASRRDTRPHSGIYRRRASSVARSHGWYAFCSSHLGGGVTYDSEKTRGAAGGQRARVAEESAVAIVRGPRDLDAPARRECRPASTDRPLHRLLRRASASAAGARVTRGKDVDLRHPSCPTPERSLPIALDRSGSAVQAASLWALCHGHSPRCAS